MLAGRTEYSLFSAFQILKNPDKYIVLHRRQKEYEAAYGENTFFSLPPRPTSSDQRLQRGDATVGELDRSDANIKDTSFTLTKLKMSLEEKANEIWMKLVSGDKAFLMASLKTNVALIRSTATIIGGDDDK